MMILVVLSICASLATLMISLFVLSGLRRESNRLERSLREDLRSDVRDVRDTLFGRFDRLREENTVSLAQVALRIERLTESNRDALDKLKDGIDQRLRSLQEDNGQKLELMRQTVDEKLQGTLEKRLGESFKQVSERLEQVHKGLGEMQNVAASVGDLRKALVNVKTRGGWGEVQLQRILEEFLTAAQFDRNVRIDPATNEHVEFAVRMPHAEGETVWLPIDSKFPMEDYQRLVDASERAHTEDILVAGKALETSVRRSAREISEKYIKPPYTVEFGIMFLPTEGLYAEIVRRPGLVDAMLQEHRVMIAGPTNLYALLTTVQTMHRSVVLQKRSAEVWQLLAAVKTEFSSYGRVLLHVKKKLQEASNTVDKVEVRKRMMERALRSVEAAPTSSLLLLDDADDELMEEASGDSAAL